MGIYYDQQTELSVKNTFNKIWENYYKKIFLFCRSILRTENNPVDDIVQEVMFKIFKNLKNFKNGDSL